jgi:N-acetylglucosamine kinase-like BadF-type ATPase
MKYVIGIDGGATKTQAAILDGSGLLLGEGTGGPGNYNSAGLERVTQSVADAVAAARKQAGLPVQPFDAAFFGMAAVVQPLDRERIRQIGLTLNLAPADAIGVDHDCRIALAGGLSGRPGIVQIAGTGSSTFGLNPQGEGWRAGGWGHLISDEGGGYWFGIEALKVTVAVYDGRLPHTPLVDAVMASLELDDVNDIYQPLYVTPMSKDQIAGLAPLVFHRAEAGDSICLRLVKQGADLMADCVLAVAHRLGMDRDPVEVAGVGGLLQSSPLYAGHFHRAVSERLPLARFTEPEESPVMGAGILALQMIGAEITERLGE